MLRAATAPTADGVAARLPRWRAAAAAATVGAMLLAFAGDGLRAYFTPDDMMNLYGAWFRPLADADRPLAALVYRGLFFLYGLNPLPYRVVCFALLLANLWLLYGLSTRLSGSRETGALACLLGAYHAHLADLYYSSGTIYDLLCCTLYLSAFLLYTRERFRTWPAHAVVVVVYLGALFSKEMAVTLPVFLLLYDLLYRRPRGFAALRDWFARRAAVLAPAVAVTAWFVWFKATGSMVSNPAYRPHFTGTALMHAWTHYTFDLFYGWCPRTNTTVVGAWALALALVLLLRRRETAMAAAIAWVGVLPVIFIVPRGFFSIYLALPGWYLLAASALVAARRALFGRQGQAALFAGCALALAPLHADRRALGMAWVAEAHNSVRSVAAALDRRAGPMPHAAKVLFLSDPYPVDDWILTFIFRLHYRDDEIRVDRARAMAAFPGPVQQAAYDKIFRLDGGELTLQPRPAPATAP